jgi:hypothetical protein
LLLLAFAVFAQSGKEREPQPYDAQEAYEVYAAALAMDHLKGKLLIADTTVPFNECLDSRSDKPADAAIGDYKQANKTRWRLQRKFALKRNYQLISSEEVKRLQRPDPKGGLFWYFPRGVQVIHFSAVGFNADRTNAFVERDVVCGDLCGHGSPFLLQKRNGKWREYSPPWVENPDGTAQGTTITVQGMTICSWNY